MNSALEILTFDQPIILWIGTLTEHLSDFIDFIHYRLLFTISRFPQRHKLFSTYIKTDRKITTRFTLCYYGGNISNVEGIHTSENFKALMVFHNTSYRIWVTSYNLSLQITDLSITDAIFFCLVSQPRENGSLLCEYVCGCHRHRITSPHLILTYWWNFPYMVRWRWLKAKSQ